MKQVYTLEDLLVRNTNGYTCNDCGQLWLDHLGSPSLAFTLTKGFDGSCRHPMQYRTRITRSQLQGAR